MNSLNILPRLLFPLDASALALLYCFSILTLYSLYYYAVCQFLAILTTDTVRNEDHHSLVGISISGSDTLVVFCGTEYQWRDPKCESTMVGHGTRKELLVPLDIIDCRMGRALCHWCKLNDPLIQLELTCSWQSRRYPCPWHAGTWNECGDGRN